MSAHGEHPVPHYYDAVGALQSSRWKCPLCGREVVASAKTKGVPLIVCAECYAGKKR